MVMIRIAGTAIDYREKVTNLMFSIDDLYSDMLLNSDVEPVFHRYYNVEFRDGFSMPVHSHEHIEIMYARKGSCEVYAGEDKYRLEPGNFILLNGGIPHRLFVNPEIPCRVLCVEFNFLLRDRDATFLRRIFNEIREVALFLKAGKNVIKLEDSAEIYSVLNGICRELEHDESGKSTYIYTAFCQLIIKLARLFAENENVKEGPADKYVRNAISYMNNNYHKALNIKQIAEQVNLNVSYFYKIFKRITGLTPIDYLTEIRVKKAENLLGMSDLPVVDVAIITGFSSRQYFNYIFKKQTGVTPSEYRRSYKIGLKPASTGV